MPKTRNGISLVEVTIVLAISSLLLIIAASTFSMRTRTVVDDAAKQVESVFQRSRNEAVQGLGTTTGATFNTGDELYGQAIQFRNNCKDTQACITVFKLKKSAAPANVISDYESYEVLLREGLEFGYNLPANCEYVSCYQQTDTMKLLSAAPISMVIGQVPMVVIKNGNGGSYLFSSMINTFGSPLNVKDEDNYTTERQGIFQLAVFRREDTSTTPQTAIHKYFLNINLATGEVIIKNR
jgi:type II secretory pathway pseudopilin PulG